MLQSGANAGAAGKLVPLPFLADYSAFRFTLHPWSMLTSLHTETTLGVILSTGKQLTAQE